MPFQTKNDRLSCPQNEGMNHFLKSSFWGLEPYRFWTAENQNLILRVWSLPIISPENQDLILRSWSNQSDKMSLWSCPGHFVHSVILIPKIVTSLAECSFWSLGEPSPKRERSLETRPNSPWFALPPRIPAARVKTPHVAFLGHTRELADILSVRYVGESVPGKYPLTIRRKKDRFGEVFPQKLIIYLRILDILSLNSHRKSKSTPPLKANLQFVYRNQWSLI